MLIVMVVGWILVGTTNQGGAGTVTVKQLSKDISNCLCGSGTNAFKFGCKTYIVKRLQSNQTPEKAVLSANRNCESQYGLAKPDGNIQCKEGVTFLRNKE